MKIKVIKTCTKKADYPYFKIYYEKSNKSFWKFHYIFIGIVWLNINYLIIITDE
jgi:preprotein translocase subunit Sec63